MHNQLPLPLPPILPVCVYSSMNVEDGFIYRSKSDGKFKPCVFMDTGKDDTHRIHLETVFINDCESNMDCLFVGLYLDCFIFYSEIRDEYFVVQMNVEDFRMSKYTTKVHSLPISIPIHSIVQGYFLFVDGTVYSLHRHCHKTFPLKKGSNCWSFPSMDWIRGYFQPQMKSPDHSTTITDETRFNMVHDDDDDGETSGKVLEMFIGAWNTICFRVLVKDHKPLEEDNSLDDHNLLVTYHEDYRTLQVKWHRTRPIEDCYSYHLSKDDAYKCLRKEDDFEMYRTELKYSQICHHPSEREGSSTQLPLYNNNNNDDDRISTLYVGSIHTMISFSLDDRADILRVLEIPTKKPTQFHLPCSIHTMFITNQPHTSETSLIKEIIYPSLNRIFVCLVDGSLYQLTFCPMESELSFQLNVYLEKGTIDCIVPRNLHAKR